MKQIWIVAGLLGLTSAAISQAHQQSWPGKRLAETLAQGSSFSKKQVSLNPAQVAWTERNLGETIQPEDKTPVFYTATDAAKTIVGYVLFLDATGSNGKIELGVATSPEGSVLNTVLFEHSETKAVSNPTFLSQFKGKKAKDPFKIGQDLTSPKGSEAAAQSIATAVRRSLLVTMAGLGLSSKKQGP